MGARKARKKGRLRARGSKIFILPKVWYIMSPSIDSTIEERTEEIVLIEEPKIIKALEIYYIGFGTENSVTFNYAVHQAGANSARAVWYQHFRKEYRLGMPETRGEALEYLEELTRLKNDIGIF